MGNVADELALGFVEFRFAGHVLNRHGNAAQTVFCGIQYSVEQNSDGTVIWFGEGNGELGPFFHFAANNLIQRPSEFDLNGGRQDIERIFAFDRPVPTEDAAGGGVDEDNLKLSVEENGSIGDRGHQGF